MTKELSNEEELKKGIDKLKKDAKEKEKNLFANFESKLKNFPLKKEMYKNNMEQEKAKELVTYIVYFLLYKEGEIVTLSKHENNLKEYLKEHCDATKSNELKISLKNKDNGKSISMYDENFYQTLELKEEYQENDDKEYYNEDKETNFRIEDAIIQLQKLLFDELKILNFYDEYGEIEEIRNNPKNFIDFVKKILREDVFVSRHFNEPQKEKNTIVLTSKDKNTGKEIKEEKKVNRTFGAKIYHGRKQYEDDKYCPIEDKKICNDVNENEYIVNILQEYSQDINNKILTNIKDQDSIKILTISYNEYKNYVDTDMNLQPKNMKLFTLFSKCVDDKILNRIKKDFQNLTPLEKRVLIDWVLDTMHFWRSFYNIHKDYVDNFDYIKENEKIKQSDKLIKQLSRSKDDVIKNISEMIETYLKEQNIEINDNLKDSILIMCRRMFLKTGGNVTKQELVTFSKKLREQESCEQYRRYIYLDVIHLLDNKNEKAILEGHLKNCSNCKKYKEYVSKGIGYRKNRNKMLKITQNPYLETNVKTEEDYNNIKIEDYCYTELKKTKSPIFHNYYILSLIKSGKIEEAKEIMKNRKKFVNENLIL